jgi:hypothetical protein
MPYLQCDTSTPVKSTAKTLRIGLICLAATHFVVGSWYVQRQCHSSRTVCRWNLLLLFLCLCLSLFRCVFEMPSVKVVLALAPYPSPQYKRHRRHRRIVERIQMIHSVFRLIPFGIQLRGERITQYDVREVKEGRAIMICISWLVDMDSALRAAMHVLQRHSR